MTKQPLIIAAGIAVIVVWTATAALDHFIGNIPIVFYGRLVDQDDNGVAGMTVTGRVDAMKRLAFLNIEDGMTEWTVTAITDANGNFTIQGGHGKSLSLSATAPGYIGDCGDTYEYSPPSTVTKTYKPDPNHPEVFKYWKIRGHEHLSENHLRVHMKSDGRIYTVDLVKGDSHEGDDGVGDLRVSIKAGDQPVGATSRRWTFKVEAIGGGFSLAPDRRIYFEAPPDGYAPVMSFDMSSRAIRTSLYGSHYYLKSHGGTVYSSILMHPDIANEPMIDIDYRVNPNGSRLLEP